MMEKEQLRKADIFSGGVIVAFGLWVIGQALQMPMKDSWGGVQNVWFVSPALFPLFVGAMIALLGGLLIRTALKQTGAKGFVDAVRWLSGAELRRFVVTAPVIRFYAVCVLLVAYVYLHIPRVDFFVCSVLFLAAFITMFYFDDDALLLKLLGFFLCGTALFGAFLAFGGPTLLAPAAAHPNDWFTLLFLLGYVFYSGRLARGDAALRKKYRTAMILSVAAPFLIGPVFKYLLLVPMPTEGLVVVLMDAVRYWDF